MRVCHKHKGKYNEYPVQVEENPQCVQHTGRERQLFNITSECVVDPKDPDFGMCLVNEFDTSVNQTEGEQFKDLIQIKLPYDGSNPYNGCNNVSQTCYVCGNGHHNKDNTGDVAKQCEPCPAGTESGPFNNNNGRECVACDGVNTYQDEEGGASCKVVDTCAAGHYITQNASSTQNRLCQVCLAGSMSSGENQANCTACDGVSYYQDQPGQSSCKTVSSCPAGQGVTQNATTISDTQCEHCNGESTYSDVDSKTASCQVVNVCDPDTEVESREPTASLDRLCQCAAGHYDNQDTCTECPTGRYQPSANQATTCPNTWSDCAAGTYISANGTTTNDRTCTSCASGSFTSTTNQNTCTTWAVCGSNQYVSVQGSSSNNRECADKKEDGSSCTANQECTSNECNEDGLCITSCEVDSNCTHITDNYCNTEYGICLEKSTTGEPCEVSGNATDGACLSGFCDSGSGTCVEGCSDINCGGCADQASCDTADHYTYCAWQYYNAGQCDTCPAGGDINCQDTSTHFCAPCGESVPKFGYGIGCGANNECSSNVCVNHLCGQSCTADDNCDTSSEFCDPNPDNGYRFCKPKKDVGNACAADQECSSGFCDLGSYTCAEASSGSGEYLHVETSTDDGHSCAIKHDNTLWCWGRNDEGQVGTGSINDDQHWLYGLTGVSPTQVVSIDNVISVSLGNYHTCAIKNDNTLWCWGSNDYGQLGDGTQNDKYTPTQVNTATGLDTVSSVSLGAFHTCATKTDNTLWCWGMNTYGQLGDGTQGNENNRNTPTQVSGIGTVSSISLGAYHTCAIKTDNTVYCWGRNNYGQLGDGTQGNENNRNTPTQVSGLGTVSSVSSGSDYTCAVKSDNTVYCWGNNDYGQLGVTVTYHYPDGYTKTAKPELLPVQAMEDQNVFLQNVDQVFAGNSKTCVLLLDNTVKCRGRDFNGQLGIGPSPGDQTDKFVFVETGSNTVLAGVQQMSSRSSYSIVILDDGSVYGWGRNNHNQLAGVNEDVFQMSTYASDLGLPTSGGGGGGDPDAGDGGGYGA